MKYAIKVKFGVETVVYCLYPDKYKHIAENDLHQIREIGFDAWIEEIKE